MTRSATLKILSLILAVLLPAALALQQDDAPPSSGAGAGADDAPPPVDELNLPDTPASDRAVIDLLLEEVDRLKRELARARAELAEARLQANESTRELEELRQFIQDNREYGDAYEQYTEIRRIAEQAERRRLAEEARLRRIEEMERRRAAREAGAAERSAERAEEATIERYRRAGFQPLGLDVYIGRTGFFYGVDRQIGTRVEYEPIIGRFLEPIASERIDFSQMTISGSVLNASEEVRNIGVAVAFFDEYGNQVGAETIQINNARPDVPYPFTSTIAMALDRPFASSTSWVLYADPVE